jgi:hypothetical protein
MTSQEIQDAANLLYIKNNSGSHFKNITTNASTIVRNDGNPCVLKSVIINKLGASSNTATIYNGNSTGGTKICTIDTTSASPQRNFNVLCDVGIFVVTATGTAADITIVYDY